MRLISQNRRDDTRTVTRAAPLAAAVLALFILPGCATDLYADRYAPQAYGQSFPPVNDVRVVQVQHVDPEIVRDHDFPGSTLIGTATFAVPSSPARGPQRQAQRVGADTVIVSRWFEGERRHLRYETVPVTGFRTESFRDRNGRYRDRTLVVTDYDVVPVTRDVPYHRYVAWFLRTDGLAPVQEGVPLPVPTGGP